MAYATSTPGAWSYNEAAWLQTATGKALNVTLGGAVQVAGVIGYVRI